MPTVRRAGALTVHELFRATARARPTMVAARAGARVLSFAELDERARRVAGLLVREGVVRGDRIAVVSENRLDYLVIVLAAASLGAIVACQNWRLAPPELAHCLSLVTPKLALVSGRHANLFAASEVEVPAVIGLDDGWDARVLASSPVDGDLGVEPEDGLLVIYTSGTTGLPKGAVVSHRAEIARMAVQQIDLGVGPDDAFVAWGPMFHMASADQMLAANARDFVDGYFRMGDMFRRGPDARYDFVDRAKYLIKSGGENIYPAEIERVLLADERIIEAVVVRKPDERWGEVPVAFVAIAVGVSGVSEAEVIAICRASLAAYKRPREVRFVGFDDFPRSATGKIQRHEVEKKWL